MFKKLRKIFYYFLSIVFSALILISSVFFYYGRNLPNESTLIDYTPPTTSKIYSRDGELLEEYAIEHRVIVPFEKIPVIVKGAFMIAEDREFYTHSGISLVSLTRAIIENTAKKSWNKKPAGGSTITQQIAKNLLVGSARSISRKIKEAIMAFRIEATIPKDRILEIYLNQLYLGKGCYGISEACNYYFCKTLDKIEPEEAAFLAAIPSAPSVYINMKSSAKILLKRNSILYQMHELGFISQQELKKAISTPISIKLRKNKFSSPYFSDEIFRIFMQKISKDALLRCGYSITTTMDKNIQHCATESLEDGLIEHSKTQNWRGSITNIKNKMGSFEKTLSDINKNIPSTINRITSCVVIEKNKDCVICKTAENKNIEIQTNTTFYKNANLAIGDVIYIRYLPDSNTYELYQLPETTGGIVIMDPKNGEILGMAGGYSFDISSFNCITQAKRQPGSVIKPFVYAAALEKGLDEFDIIKDKPVNITLSNGIKYCPHNYNNQVFGDTYLRDGLIYSRNLLTVNLALQIGMETISNMLRQAGLIKNKIPISAVLGAIETTPLNIISAFSAFVNEGTMVYPKFVLSITQSNEKHLSKTLEKILVQSKYKNIMSKESANTVKEILHDATKYGTASSLSNFEDEYDIEIGGKTGTTNNFKDAWFIGYITQDSRTYLVCVFVGYQTPKSLGDHATGAQVALPIFANFIKNFSKN